MCAGLCLRLSLEIHFLRVFSLLCRAPYLSIAALNLLTPTPQTAVDENLFDPQPTKTLSSLPADGHENIVRSLGFCDRTPGCPIFLEVCSGGDLFNAAVEGDGLFGNARVLG